MGFFDSIKDAVSTVFPVAGIANGLGGDVMDKYGGALGGKGGAENQRIMNIPWNAKELEWLQKQAKGMYEDGPPAQYPGSRVAPLDPRLQQTLNSMMGFGMSNPPAAQPLPEYPNYIAGTGKAYAGGGGGDFSQLGQVIGYPGGETGGAGTVGGLASQGGTALQQALAGISQQQLSGETQQGIGDYAAYLMNLGQQGGAGSNVGQIAQNTDPSAAIQAALGDPGQNPYVDQLVQQTVGDLSRNLNENIMPRLDQASLNNNAYGGSRQALAQGQAVDATQRQAADASTRIRANAYEGDQSRRMQAASLASQLAGQADRQGNAQAELGLAGANLGRGLTSDLANIAPVLQAYEGANLATQMQGGQAYQQYLQSLLSDDVSKFNYAQNADRNNVDWLNNIYSGIGSLGSVQSQNMPEASFIERILGGASTGLGSYGALSSAAVPGAGWIAGGLGLLSALS